jgi:glutathione peroxidase
LAELNRLRVLLAQRVGQPIEGLARPRASAERGGQPLRYDYLARHRVGLQGHPDPVAEVDAGGAPVLPVQGQVEATAVNRDRAAEGVAVDRDRDLRPLTAAKAGHDVRRHLEERNRARLQGPLAADDRLEDRHARHTKIGQPGRGRTEYGGRPATFEWEMTVYEVEVPRLSGEPARLSEFEGKVVLVVNVASKCGFTPQYAGLQKLHDTYAERGFSVVGFPCNQFGGQEPGEAEQIQSFCSLNYGVTFPLFTKVEVNGPGRHPLYEVLTTHADDNGKAGDVAWNFEKFLVGRDGSVLRRFRSKTAPEDPAVTTAIEAALQ